MEKEQWCWRISVPNLLCDVNYQCPLKTEMHSSFTLIRTINIRRGASFSLHFVCPLASWQQEQWKAGKGLWSKAGALSLASTGKNCKSCLLGEKEYETEGGPPPPGPGAVTGLLETALYPLRIFLDRNLCNRMHKLIFNINYTCAEFANPHKWANVFRISSGR